MFDNLFCYFHRSHRPEHEVRRPKLLLLHIQQSRSGRRWRRDLRPAQSSGGDGGEAAHRRVPGVCGLPAPLCRWAGKPDSAAELSPSQTVPTPFPPLSLSFSVAPCFTHSVRLSHTKRQTHTSDTAVHSGSYRYSTFTCSHEVMLCRTGQNISRAETWFMHLVDLSALLCVAIHLINFVTSVEPPFVSGSDDRSQKPPQTNDVDWNTEYGVGLV